MYSEIGYFEIGLLFDFAVLIIYLLLRRPHRVARSPHPRAACVIGVVGWVLSLIIYAGFTTYYGDWVLRAVDWMEGYALLPLLGFVVRKGGGSDKERT